jgi:replicative DNA helicase
MSQESAAVRPDQLAPHSVEAEEAVLGSVLINPDALFEVASFLQPDDFFIVRNGWVWEAILRLQERNEQIDYVTVVEELRQQERLEEIGGAAYITYLINHTPSSIYTETYGRIVERAAIRRRMLSAASDIARLAHEEDADINEITDQAEATLFAVTERQLRKELVPIRTAIADYFDRIEFLYSHQAESLGVPTGFNDLDQLLGGLQKSDLVIVAGRPGMGKTSWLLSAALNAARAGARVAIFSMEMSTEQIVQRLVSSETGIGTHSLRLGKLDDREWALFVEATGNLGKLRIYLDDTPALSPLQLRAKCRRLFSEHGLDLIMVDYLQLMIAGTGRSENRVQEISFITRNMKQIAREMNVPVLAAAQLSRAVEQRQDKRPQLSDLRESGCLAGDTLIYLPKTGRYVPISELAGQSSFCVTSLNVEAWKLESGTVTHAFRTGTKPVYRLTTGLGRSVRATGNHRFLTLRGWKRLDDLVPGDHIAVPRVLSNGHEQSITDAELALLGHLIGDGCTLPRHAIQYTTQEEDLAETVATLASEVLGRDIVPRIRRERNWHQVYLASSYRLTHGIRNPVSRWMQELGIFGLRSHEKQVPEKVFEQPAGAVAHFLRHLWATDGCVQMKGDYPAVYYASSSERLAQDVQSLLLRVGINSRLKRIPQNGKGRDQYHVMISGRQDLERFADSIGAVGIYRQRNLQRVTEYSDTHLANTHRDVIPAIVWRSYAVPAMQKKGITTRQMQASLENACCGTAIYRQNISREALSRLAGALQSEPIARLAESDVYWDRIISIEPDGETEVYDLTVPGPSNFVANNIVVHNSIEQDADVVMFIYRDEVYNENTERPNQADVIVAKHRNGPTGAVTLYFRKELTQFANLRKTDVDLASY